MEKVRGPVITMVAIRGMPADKSFGIIIAYGWRIG
jgi:hypothetical protein